jgi:hypothetical protein
MFYKGGPKNYGKDDWQVLAGIFGTAVVALVTIMAATSRPGSILSGKDI